MSSSSSQDAEQHHGIVRITCRILRIMGKPLEWAFIGMVRLYQIFISPILPRTCRFYPSCSQYMMEALRKKGPIIGLYMGIWRIIRCNPLCEGGYDPVEPPQGPSDKSDLPSDELDKG